MACQPTGGDRDRGTATSPAVTRHPGAAGRHGCHREARCQHGNAGSSPRRSSRIEEIRLLPTAPVLSLFCCTRRPGIDLGVVFGVVLPYQYAPSSLAYCSPSFRPRANLRPSAHPLSKSAGRRRYTSPQSTIRLAGAVQHVLNLASAATYRRSWCQPKGRLIETFIPLAFLVAVSSSLDAHERLLCVAGHADREVSSSRLIVGGSGGRRRPKMPSIQPGCAAFGWRRRTIDNVNPTTAIR